jgi:hypothetical protein
MEIVEAAGAQIALPSQTMYFADPSGEAEVAHFHAKNTK